MRKRTKVLAVLGTFIGLIALAGVVMFALVPLLPTGYAEVEKLRQEDIKEDAEKEGAQAARVVKTRTALLGITTTTQTAQIYALPTTANETPRQAFARCWRIVAIASRSMTAAELKLRSLDRLRPFWNQMGELGYHSEPRTVFSFQILPDEWYQINAPTSGTLTPVKRFQELLVKREGRPHPVSSGLLHPELIPQWSPSAAHELQEHTKLLDQVLERGRNLAPLREAAELLRLPDGAVPVLPPEGGIEGIDYNVFFGFTPQMILIHAFLNGMANDPGFDPARALRRLNDIQHFRELECYPQGNVYFYRQAIRSLLQLACRGGLGDFQQVRSLVRGLERTDEDNRAWEQAMGEKIHRYQAAAMRRQLLATYEAILTGKLPASDNAFHYFYDGKPERAWVAINAMNVRRQIDLLAVAMAGGEINKVKAAHESLGRSLKLANIRQTNVSLGNYGLSLTNSGNENYGIDALKLTLLAWRKEKGGLPEEIGQLTPKDLFIKAWPGYQAAWIEWTEDQPVLVVVAAENIPRSEKERAIIRDPVKFRERCRGEMKRRGEMATDEQIEAFRAVLLKQEHDRVTITVSGYLLEQGKMR